MSELLAPCDPDFVHCFTPDIGQPHEVWLLTRERLRDVPRVRAVMDFLAGHLAGHPAVRAANGKPAPPTEPCCDTPPRVAAGRATLRRFAVSDAPL